MEIREKVVPVRVRRVCVVKDCGGELVCTERGVKIAHPPRFTHKCGKCGTEFVLDKRYPFVEYHKPEDILPKN